MDSELSPRAAEIATYARELISKTGYNGFSYADISEHIHIRKASIHHHFASKAELVKVVVAQYRKEARESMDALDQQMNDPLKELQMFVGYWATCIADGSNSFCICAMLATERLGIPLEVADEVRLHFLDLAGWLTSLMEKGVEKGQFCLQTDAAAEAGNLMATVHGAMLAARAMGDPSYFKAITDAALTKLTATN